MNVTLYKYYSEKNRIDKSGYLQLVESVTGEFKTDTSILSPTLFLALPNEGTEFITDESGNEIDEVVINASSVGQVLDFNYFYVAEFRRYYFVTSIVVSSKQLIYITGSVDPLYSFKDDILGNDAMVERNEFSFDAMLEDSLIPLEMGKDVAEYDADTGGLTNVSFVSEFASDSSANVTISVADRQTDEHKTITNPPYGLNDIQIGRFTAGSWLYALDFTNVNRLLTELMVEHSSLGTYFKSIIAYPFDLSVDHAAFDSSVLALKYDKDTDTYGYITMNARGYEIPRGSKYLIAADFFIPSVSSYLELNPYRKIEVYIPFYGWYELDNGIVSGHRLLVYYSVNYEDGSGEAYLWDYTENRLIFSSPVQIGVQLSITSTNAEELEAQKQAAQLNMILSLVGSGLGLIGGAASGNAIVAAGAGLTAVQAITAYNNQKSLMFTKAQSVHNGALGALYNYLKVRVRVTNVKIASSFDRDKFAHQYGRPLRQVRQLSTLSGYTQVSKVHLENCPAFDSEKAMIESSLLSGVIL